jgi:hypothetical protein
MLSMLFLMVVQHVGDWVYGIVLSDLVLDVFCNMLSFVCTAGVLVILI